MIYTKNEKEIFRPRITDFSFISQKLHIFACFSFRGNNQPFGLVSLLFFLKMLFSEVPMGKKLAR